MSTYVIGDVQGCYLTLQDLLRRVQFNPSIDRLWFVGDLVNRGPRSLEVLEFVFNLGSKALCVLGNHDLHLLLRHYGLRKPDKDDTLDAILESPHWNRWRSWLLTRPLLHEEGDYVLVHAGLHPHWSLDVARSKARLLEKALQTDPRQTLEQGYKGDLSFFTALRTCTFWGKPDWEMNGPPSQAKPGYVPWFRAYFLLPPQKHLLFGHWSWLGFCREGNFWALDSGCLWGRALTALRLEDRMVFQVSNKDF